ncbi:hypothetical protein U1E44_09310 [Arenibacter sp. GZD96]|uniref:hypothetical protein n=1 Tax=Aurantibrevibacter litoralis TaxID=3106030 RepID=UPI002AFF531A|nr:hypothetical protein [Arenibacter sp. GZD-96]MEA1786287.1 hypothetical protein [Arenibacter sp. GZD-96]
MKTQNKFFLTLAIALLTLPLLQAQYGYGNGNYGRRQSAVPRTPEPEKKVEPKTAEQIVDGEMPFLSEELELNEFENAVLRSTLVKYVQEGIELQLLKLSPEKTREGIESITKRQNEELKASLPAEKFEKLEELQKNGFKKTKKKKQKKKTKS